MCTPATSKSVPSLPPSHQLNKGCSITNESKELTQVPWRPWLPPRLRTAWLGTRRPHVKVTDKSKSSQKHGTKTRSHVTVTLLIQFTGKEGYCPKQARNVLPSTKESNEWSAAQIASEPGYNGEHIQLGNARGWGWMRLDAHMRKITPPRAMTGMVKDRLHSSLWVLIQNPKPTTSSASICPRITMQDS